MIHKVLYHQSLEWYYKNDLFRNDTLIIDLKELMDLNENNYNLDAMKKEDIYIKMVINLIIINWLQIRWKKFWIKYIYQTDHAFDRIE